MSKDIFIAFFLERLRSLEGLKTATDHNSRLAESALIGTVKAKLFAVTDPADKTGRTAVLRSLGEQISRDADPTNRPRLQLGHTALFKHVRDIAIAMKTPPVVTTPEEICHNLSPLYDRVPKGLFISLLWLFIEEYPANANISHKGMALFKMPTFSEIADFDDFKDLFNKQVLAPHRMRLDIRDNGDLSLVVEELGNGKS